MVTVTSGGRSRLVLAVAVAVGSLVLPVAVHAATRHAAMPVVLALVAPLPGPALEVPAAPDVLEAPETPAVEIAHAAEIAQWEEAVPIAAPAIVAPAMVAPPVAAPAIASSATIQLQRAQVAAPATQAQDAAAPVEAVTAFYTAIAQRRLDGALQTWSPRMRATYPPGIYLYDRFAGTGQMTVRSAVVTSMDPAAGRATVAVELAESSSVPAFNRAWSGTWFLVRVGNAWLLDAPSFRA